MEGERGLVLETVDREGKDTCCNHPTVLLLALAAVATAARAAAATATTHLIFQARRGSVHLPAARLRAAGARENLSGGRRALGAAYEAHEMDVVQGDRLQRDEALEELTGRGRLPLGLLGGERVGRRRSERVDMEGHGGTCVCDVCEMCGRCV